MFRERFADDFIGREEEIRAFEMWLEPIDHQTPNILFLYSALNKPNEQGGLGKTWLLHRFADIAKLQNIAVVWIDFMNVADRSPVTIARRTVEQLNTLYSDWIPSAFEHALDEYKRSSHQSGTHQDLLANIHVTLQQDLQVLSARFTGTGKRLLVFFDTFEVVEQDPLQVTLDTTSSFPDTYGFSHIGFVIAGRHAPDWNHSNWAERKGAVRTMPISPFTPQEMLDYYNKQVTPWYHAEMVKNAQRLYELTGGRPILVSLIADLFSDENAPSLVTLLDIAPQDAEKQLVLRINDLTQSVNLAVLAMAHVYHRFNRDLFIKIFAEHRRDEADLEKVWDRLLKLSFVRFTSNREDVEDVTLHDEMRDLVNKYNWPAIEKDVQGPKRRDLSLTVIDYYQQAIDDTDFDPYISQTYLVEQLYHKLFVDPERHWTTFRDLFGKANGNWQLTYARNLLREAERFALQFSQDQRAELLLQEIRLLRREERYQESFELCERFPERVDRDWLVNNAYLFLFHRGECYRFTSRSNDALSCFTQIVFLHLVHAVPQNLYAEVLSRIGIIYEQRNDFDKAVRFYEESLSIFKVHNIMRYVDVINHLCHAYCSQGKVEEALWRSIIALNICREKQQPSEISIMLPDSLHTVGTVYIFRKDFAKADQYLQEAKELFESIQNKKGMAKVYHSLGRCEMEKGNYANAKLWLENAYLASRTIDAGIEIECLYKLAQVNLRLGYKQDTIDALSKAITRAQEIRNSYREVELRLELAAVLETSWYEGSVSMYEQATAVAKREKYYSLLGVAERWHAHYHYYVQKYEQAFYHFAQLCYWMAQFTEIEYKRAISEALEHLLALNGDELCSAWEALNKFWMEQTPKLSREEAACMQEALDEVRLLVDILC